MRFTASLVLAAALLLPAACSRDKNVEWTSISADDGSFRAELPGTPQRVHHAMNTAAGPAPIEMWLVQEDERVFMVGYTEYPEKVRTVVADQELLDSARDGAIDRVHGKLLIDEPHDSGTTKGRRIEIDADGGRVRVRGDLFVDGRRLYQVFVTVSPQEIESERVTRFLDSFRLLPHAPAEEKRPGTL